MRSDGGGVDVDGVQREPRHRRAQRGRDRRGPAAQLDDHGAGPQERDREVDEQLGAAAGHEHPGADGDARPAELHPAQQVLQRLARDAPVDQGGEVGGGGGGVDEQPGLLLGEDAAGRTQGGHDGCEGRKEPTLRSPA